MNAREQNRRNFPFAAAMLDAVRTMDPSSRMTYAANDAGKTVGKRDPGPFVSGAQYVSACAWTGKRKPA